jgi:hypothetical protein
MAQVGAMTSASISHLQTLRVMMFFEPAQPYFISARRGKQIRVIYGLVAPAA